MPFSPCIIIPCYNHAAQFEKFLPQLLPLPCPLILVDDGSAPEDAARLAKISAEHGLIFCANASNLGKGEALRRGLREARARGFSHALQCDADGQHEPEAISRFFEIARKRPEAYVCGDPVYDSSAPRARVYGRKITDFWVALETLSLRMGDALCGFRVYPLARVAPLLEREIWGRGMGFDIRILVEIFWSGTPLVFAPLRVIYPAGGVSHFHAMRGNVDVSLTHAALFCRSPLHVFANLRGKIFRA